MKKLFNKNSYLYLLKILLLIIFYVIVDHLISFSFAMNKNIVLPFFIFMAIVFFVVKNKREFLCLLWELVFCVICVLEIVYTIYVMNKNLGEAGFGFIAIFCILPLIVLDLLL